MLESRRLLARAQNVRTARTPSGPLLAALLLGLAGGVACEGGKVGEDGDTDTDTDPGSGEEETKSEEGDGGEEEGSDGEEGSDVEEDGDDDDDGEGEASDEAEGETGETGDVEPFNISGIVVDEQGQPVEGAMALICGPKPPQGGCLFMPSEADGSFEIEFNMPGTFKFSVGPSEAIADDDFSMVAFQLHLEAGEQYVFEKPIVFPKTEDLKFVKDGPELEVTDELTFIIDEEHFELPYGSKKEPHMAADRLDDEVWKAYEFDDDVGDDELVAVWALNPYEAKSEEAPIGFRISNEDFGFPAGAKVPVFVVDHYQGLMVELEVDAEVSADGKTIEPAEGLGMHEVTWLAIGRPRE